MASRQQSPAREASGLMPTTIYDLIATGDLQPRKVTKRRIISVDSLLNLVKSDAGREPEVA